ncbi:MAG: sulfotransferase [Anaerolineae bacterium]|nr:sulfotransferase [Anaerolineae bacterium]
MSHTLRILFITGNSRSGSTFLGTALGQTQGIFCAGELQRIWDGNWLKEEFCSCGRPILDCPFWKPVFEEVIGTYSPLRARALRHAHDRIVKVRSLPRLLLSRSLAQLPTDILSYLQVTRELYLAIQRHSGCSMIVDTSKYPTYSYLLRLLPEIDLRVVHLVRDPRAVAYSWKRVKRYPTANGEREMERHSPLRSAAAWSILNGLAQYLWGRDERYLLVRYEDFVHRPREVSERILDHVGMPGALRLSSANEIEINTHHVIAGNANRFRKGKVAIRPDEEWRHALPRAEQLLVTLATLPMLPKLGYASWNTQAASSTHTVHNPSQIVTGGVTEQ